jgi:ubiquinone/menaquinone biosynthesis C-methylase UbiE
VAREFADIASFGENWLARQYVMRARFSVPYGQQAQRALDIAAGSGYGTNHLAINCPNAEVIGADLSVSAVECATRLYQSPNLSFETNDAFDLSHEDGAFDLVISFETLEHVVDGEGFMRGLKRVLCDDGTMLLSTPHDGWAIPMKQHVKTYQPEEFLALCRRHFDEVEELFQFQTDEDRADQMKKNRRQQLRQLCSLPITLLAKVTPRFLKDARKRALRIDVALPEVKPYIITDDQVYPNEEVTPDHERPGAHAHILVAVCRKPKRG